MSVATDVPVRVVPPELVEVLQEFRMLRRCGTITIRMDDRGMVSKIEETYVRKINGSLTSEGWLP